MSKPEAAPATPRAADHHRQQHQKHEQYQQQQQQQQHRQRRNRSNSSDTTSTSTSTSSSINQRQRTTSSGGLHNRSNHHASSNGSATPTARARSLLEIASQSARSIFQRKKEVRFSKYDHIRKVPSTKDFPPTIRESLFYNKRDMKRISMERKRSVAQLTAAQNNAETPVPPHPIGHGHIHSEEWGLETQRESESRVRTSKRAIHAVLLEQELQWEESDVPDDELIADAYQEVTFRAQLEAHQRALRAELEVQQYLCIQGRWEHDKNSRRSRSKKTKRPSHPSAGLRQPKRQVSVDKHAPRRAHSESAILSFQAYERQLSDSDASISTFSGDESDSAASIPTPITASKRPIQMPIRQTSDPKLYVPPDSPLTPSNRPPRRTLAGLPALPLPIVNSGNGSTTSTPTIAQQSRQSASTSPQLQVNITTATQQHSNASSPAVPSPKHIMRVSSDVTDDRRHPPQRSPSDSKLTSSMSSNSMEDLMRMASSASDHTRSTIPTPPPSSPVTSLPSTRQIRGAPISFGPQSAISLPPTSGGLSSWVRI